MSDRTDLAPKFFDGSTDEHGVHRYIMQRKSSDLASLKDTVLVARAALIPLAHTFAEAEVTIATLVEENKKLWIQLGLARDATRKLEREVNSRTWRGRWARTLRWTKALFRMSAVVLLLDACGRTVTGLSATDCTLEHATQVCHRGVVVRAGADTVPAMTTFHCEPLKRWRSCA